MKRVVIYVRVSRVGARELQSHIDQERIARAVCDAHGFHVVDVVVDLDASGAKANRRNLEAVVGRVKSGEVDGIVVYNLSRLARLKPIDRVRLFDDIEGRGGFVWSCSEPNDVSTPQGRWTRDIFLGVARMEWELKAEGFEDRKVVSIANGVHITGTVTFGYLRAPRVNGQAQPLVVDEARGHIVTRAFAIRAAGGTIGDVTRYLDDAAPDISWQVHRVSRMLKCRTYLGEARQGTHVKPDAHPALVTQDVFDVVQAMFTNADPERKTNPKNLLAGVARCATCGYTMERNLTGGKWMVYRCKGRSGQGRCPAPASVAADALEDFVASQFLTALDRDGAMVEVVSTDLSDLHADLAAARSRKAQYLIPAVAAQLSEDELATALSAANEDIQAAETALAEAVAKNGHDDIPTPTEVVKLWDGWDTEQRRIALRGYIDTVQVLRVPRGTAIADRIRIFWIGDTDIPAKPSRGRKKSDAEVAAGELAA